MTQTQLKEQRENHAQPSLTPGFIYRFQDEIDQRMLIRAAFEKAARNINSSAIEVPLVSPVRDFIGKPPRPLGERSMQRLFSSVTPEGVPSAVRYEGTALTAKYVAYELTNDPSIQLRRYHYFQEMVRIELEEELDARHFRSFYQAGVELFAKTNHDHQANVLDALELAIKFLQMLNLKPRIRISHIDILSRPLKQVVGLASYDQKRILGLFEKKSYSQLAQLLNGLRIPTDIASLLMDFAVQDEIPLNECLPIIAKYPGLFNDALKEFEWVIKGLRAKDIEYFCTFDPGIYRSLDFYSGLTFQGDTEEIRECMGGGVFSGLVESFGSFHSFNSVGLGFGVERLMSAQNGN